MDISLPRFASRGAVGGLLGTVLVQGLFASGVSINTAGVLTLMGAGSAAGSLALARRAEDKELLEAEEEALALLEAESAQWATRWPSPHHPRILGPCLIPPNA